MKFFLIFPGYNSHDSQKQIIVLKIMYEFI